MLSSHPRKIGPICLASPTTTALRALLSAAMPSGSRTWEDSSMMIQSSSVSSARLLRIEKQVDAMTG